MSRHYLLTFNKFNEETIETLKAEDWDFLLIAKEKAPTTGHEHLHVQIQYMNKLRITTLKKRFKEADIRVIGKDNGVTKYVEKDGEVLFKEGTLDRQGKRNDLIEAYERLEKGENIKSVAHDFPSDYMRYYRAFDAVSRLKFQAKTDYEITYINKKELGEILSKLDPQTIYYKGLVSGPWNGFKQQDNVFVQGPPDALVNLEYHIPHSVDIKYGEIPFGCKTLYILTEHMIGQK